MPRAKLDTKSEYKLLLWEIAYLKSYSTDLLHDAKVIYQTQLKKYENWYSNEQSNELLQRIQILSGIKVQLANSNRVYIVCRDDFFSLVMYNMDESVVDHLWNVYDFLNTDADENLDAVSPEYRSALFIFKGKELALHAELSSGQLATLTAVFHKENLINFSGARDDYYGRPRRKSKGKA